MIHQHDAWTLDRLAEYRQEALMAEAEQRRELHALAGSMASQGLRQGIGRGMIRLGAWVAGKAADDLFPAEGRLSSAG